ncbi:unnamed protein product [Porites evermanni]|uniref:Methyltransferase type 11 domain-containing protein n=2 Tax=Porites TaxID=46719 RepID=A0ABN8SG02_9CNID|nr:unnamed protein product [Porites evermanni]
MADTDDIVREFTTDVSLYEKGRPEYLKESVEFLLSCVGALRSANNGATKLLEIAAGTGKFTRVMAEILTEKKANVKVIASDSQEAMCDMFRRCVPRIEILRFPAENIAFPDESFSAVICAQSFHWFANATSVSEISRVLQPGGKYGMIWNHRDFSVPWVRAMQDIIDPFVKQKDMPADPRELKWMESLNNSGKFTSVERNTAFRTYLEGDMDSVLSVVMCISAISQSSKEKRVEVEAKIRDILTNHPDLKGTKVYKLPYITDICWCTKK